jgi:predicted ferric reductase
MNVWRVDVMKQRIFWFLVLIITLLLILAWGGRYDFDLGGPQVLRQLNLLFAVLGFLFFFLQFLLSTHHPVVEKGFGLDKMILKHRHVGRIAMGFLLLHPVFFFLFRGGVFVRGTSMTIGLIVLLGLVVTASLASLHKILGFPYELWLNVHKANYALFPLAFVHVFNQATPPQSALLFLGGLCGCLFPAPCVQGPEGNGH